ncbi:MAG: patatin-like phospholipase family protein [Betaproteobacteria bacterium]|nr:patatin-like phospholipase family protein [Betaproteobacteria bacterium]
MKKRVALAFQGGGFPAGALGAGVVKYLVEKGAFDHHDIDVFSGTSAGALVASVCWGHKLRGRIEDAPEVLEKQWMHFASGLVPNAKVAQMAQLMGVIGQMNPMYRYASEHVVVPLMRQLMKDWVLTYIPVDELIELRDKSMRAPGLALGAAEVLKGEVKVFTEKDLCLEAILASGSLDEVNGITVIEEGPNKGIYCDGAWGTNPPINCLIDYGVDEIWLVEVFPKIREKVPETPGERKDRKDELWQNSLVEHELDDIDRLNRWLESGRLNNEDRKYRHIDVRKMPMTLDLPAGAALVNSASFIRQMIDYGYDQAKSLWVPPAGQKAA